MRSTSRPFPLFDIIIHSIFDGPFVIRDSKLLEALGCAVIFTGVRLLVDPVVQTLSISAPGQAEAKQGCLEL